MKKVFIILFLFVFNYSFAQKLAGVYDSNAGMGIFMFIPAGSMEVSKPIPESIGMPDDYWPSICQYNGKYMAELPSTMAEMMVLSMNII